MILDQQCAMFRKYGATNALIFNGSTFHRNQLRHYYKQARRSGCKPYEARQLLWNALWLAHLVNGARDNDAVTFVSHRDRPRKVNA